MCMTASDVEFGKATDEQRQIVYELWTQGWEVPMSMEDDVEREKYLAQLELNHDSRTQHWVLYLKGYPRQVIASCQSTRRPVLVSDGSGRPARKGHAYSVCRVYTSSPYRRQGMAAYLLCRLQVQMDLDSDCSVLFSDSGEKYYATLGWKAIETSEQATLTIIPQPSARAPTPSYGPRAVPIQASELPDLCQKDQLRLTKTFNCFPADGKTRVAFLLTYPELSWHLARDEFDWRKRQLAANGSDEGNGTNGTDNTDSTNGTNGIDNANGTNGTSSANSTNDTDGTSEADTNDTAPPPLPTPTPGAITLSRRTWIYWSHDWRDKRLRILRIPRACDDESKEERAGLVAPRAQDVRDVAALLEAALAEADRCGLGKVVVWNPDGEVRAACKAVSNKHVEGATLVFDGRLDGGIPSLRPRLGGKESVVWEENYAYCWC